MLTLYSLHGYSDDDGNDYDLLVRAESPEEASEIWNQAFEDVEPGAVHSGYYDDLRRSVSAVGKNIDDVMRVNRVELPSDAGPANYRMIGWFEVKEIQ